MKPVEYCMVWKSGQTLLLVIMLGVANQAFAAVAYVWEDDLGVIHLADDAATIPQRYREHVREITVPDAPPSREEEPSAAPQPSRPPSASTEDVDFKGHDRQWWRQYLQDQP